MDGIIENNAVNSRTSFVDFLALLHQDFLDNPDTWQNNTLESFLEAAGRYAEDIQGYYDNTNQLLNADEASWQTFADILKGVKVYE
jgi:hypothetical protein